MKSIDTFIDAQATITFTYIMIGGVYPSLTEGRCSSLKLLCLADRQVQANK